MKPSKSTLLFLAVAPMLAHAQAPMQPDAGTQAASTSQQAQRSDPATRKWHGDNDCVGPASFCNLFAGS